MGKYNYWKKVEQCNERCFNISMDLDTFILSKSSNGSISNIIEYDTSIELCQMLPIFDPDTPIFFPSPGVELQWNVTENESQMLDYYIGISDDTSNINMNNYKGEINTFNSTHYKCAHCGFGEGDILYITVKGVNKASLEHVVEIGPIIIDFTPPVYSYGMFVNMNESSVSLSWQFDSFTDPEDGSVIYRYEWTLGKSFFCNYNILILIQNNNIYGCHWYY